MFKKFLCIALSLMMVLCTVSVTGFAASYESGNLVASHVTFTDTATADGKTVTAQIDVTNTSSDTESGGATAVFWIGKYDNNNVLVAFDKADVSVGAGQTKQPTVSVSVAADEKDVTIKAYIWEKMVGGKAIATPATYASDSTEILYATMDGEVWSQFDNDTLTYNVELERTQVPAPAFKLYAKDNSAKITEPATFAVGENKITVTSAKGTSVEYKINLSYKAPTFKNFTSPSVQESQIFAVNNTEITVDNINSVDADIKWGTQAYVGYPSISGSKLDAISPIGSYLKTLGYDEGELYVFKRQKSITNADNYYYGGVGTYDGTNDSWFMSFDIEAAGTMYLVDQEGKGMPNAVANGWTLTSTKNVYAKHFNAGETVKVPSYGWDTAWGYAATDRNFMNPTYYLFGYDDGWQTPAAFDKKDASLKSLTYATEDVSDTAVPGFAATDVGDKTYEVTVPYGTTSVSVKATKNEGYASLTITPSEITFEAGKASATVTVTSFDKTVTNTYKINFTYDVPAVDDANLKSLTYNYAGDDIAVESFDKDTTTYTVNLPEKTSSVTVSAVANAGAKANVVINQATLTNYAGTATVVVTAEDTTTTKTYTINFTVDKAFDEQPKKIVNFTSKDAYKTDNHGYMTEAETTQALDKVVIGENLQNGSLKYYDRNNFTFSGISEDMKGATYIRVARNHSGGWSEVSSKTRVERNGVTQDSFGGYDAKTNPWGLKYGFRKMDYSKLQFYSGAYSATNGEPGWYEFTVTSDCTVVVSNVYSYEWTNGIKAGWTQQSAKDKNYIGGLCYTKTFNAGDKVQIPNYGAVSVPNGTDPVVYKYSDDSGEQTYTTTVNGDTILWDEMCIAVKWSIDKSDNANLSSLKVNGANILKDGVTEYTYYVDEGTASVTLEAVAADTKATVAAPTTITTGETATIMVTAENGITKIYKVKIMEKANDNALLSSLKYSVGSAEAVEVTGFTSETFAYTVDNFDYSKAGITVTLSAVAVDSNATIDTTNATVILTEAGTKTAKITVTAADGTTKKDYSVTFGMNDLVANAVVVATDEYKALLADTSANPIYLENPVTFTNKTEKMLTWDENGIARNRLYDITVDGVSFATGKTYSETMTIKAEQETAGKTVTLTAKGYKYEDQYKVSTPQSSQFNTSGHNFGTIGSVLKNAQQVMTHRNIAPGRVDSAYKDSSAAKTWLRTSENYLFTVTPNKKATVYVVMSQTAAKDHSQYIADGWTFLDYSSEFTKEKLNALPSEAILEAYRTLPAGISRQWWMVDPTYSISTAPLSLVKIQYDTGSDTMSQLYPYVWYKTVDADTTLKVPTIGAITGANDQAPLKAFVVYGEHDSTLNPKSNDATLKSITVDGKALEGFNAATKEYTVNLPYGSSIPTATFETNDAKASATSALVENVLTITVTAEDGTVSTYKITYVIAAAKTDATLKWIKINDVELEGFAPNTTEYEADLSSIPAVTYLINDADATVTAAYDASGNFVITVTAQDGTTKLTYKITNVPTVKSNDATLKSLTVAGTPITLEEAKLDYEFKITDGYVTVVATANDAKASVVITNEKNVTTSEFKSGKATITVTAEDKTTTKVYTVTFTSDGAGSGNIEDGGDIGDKTDDITTDIVDGNEDGGEV